MPIDLEHLWVYRILSIDNLEADLTNGLYAKNTAPVNPDRVVIGNREIINERDNKPVKCYPLTVVNDYVPFYFSVRTPMFYNIHTGRGVPQRNQADIIYLCCKVVDLIKPNVQWCFTNGNAAKRITQFFSDFKDLDKVDWRSIASEDFRVNNADGDEDRIRKKHAEFLVKDHVPAKKITEIAVYNPLVKTKVEVILKKVKLAIEVKVTPKYYFPAR